MNWRAENHLKNGVMHINGASGGARQKRFISVRWRVLRR